MIGLQGTLDLLILKTLARGGPHHGYAIAQRIHQITEDSSNRRRVALSSATAYDRDKWLRAQWGTTDTGRKARIYTITPVGAASAR